MLPQNRQIVNRFWKIETIYTIKVQSFRMGLLVAFGLVAGFTRADMLSEEKVDILRKGTVRFLGKKANLFDDILIQRDANFLFKGRTYYHLIVYDSIMQYFILKYATKYDKVRQKERQSNAII